MEMKRNNSGLKPLGRAVLVMPYEPELKKGIIELPQQVRERTIMVETRAVVVDIGPAAWDDEKEPRAKVGDKVLISKFAGALATGTRDGKQYRLVNDRDIYAGIMEEA